MASSPDSVTGSARRTLRHELLDRPIIWNERQLRALLVDYIDHYLAPTACEFAVAEALIHPHVRGVAARSRGTGVSRRRANHGRRPRLP
jgi:hypothetical protein